MLSRFVSETNAGGVVAAAVDNDYEGHEPTSVKLPSPTDKTAFGEQARKESNTLTKRVVLSNFNDHPSNDRTPTQTESKEKRQTYRGTSKKSDFSRTI